MSKNFLFLTTSAIITALYVVLTLAVAPLAFGVIQFRISELLNQLVVSNKKYIWSITLGCAIANLYSGNGPLDLVIGTAATFFGLAISILAFRFTKNISQKYIVNTVLFSTIGMLPIACMLFYLGFIPKGTFLISYLYLIISEAIIMTIGAFVLPIINSRLNLHDIIEN